MFVRVVGRRQLPRGEPGARQHGWTRRCAIGCGENGWRTFEGALELLGDGLAWWPVRNGRRRRGGGALFLFRQHRADAWLRRGMRRWGTERLIERERRRARGTRHRAERGVAVASTADEAYLEVHASGRAFAIGSGHAVRETGNRYVQPCFRAYGSGPPEDRGSGPFAGIMSRIEVQGRGERGRSHSVPLVGALAPERSNRTEMPS